MYVHTDSNGVYLCGGTDPHDHESNPEMIAVKDVRHKIKYRSLNEVTPISMFYEQKLSKTSISSTTMAIIPTCQEIGMLVLSQNLEKFISRKNEFSKAKISKEKISKKENIE
jgi:hypothetical protein